MLNVWTPKPSSLLFSLVLLGAGAWCFKSELVALGVCLWVLAWVVVVWVIVADVLDRRARYLDSMADVLNASAKNDITKINALGFTSDDIPENVKVELQDKRDGIHTTKYFDLPVHPSKLVPLARAVLDGQTFSERRWSGAGALLSSGEFRALRAVLRDRGMLELVSEADHRQGYKLNDAGRELFASLLPSPPPSVNMSKNA